MFTPKVQKLVRYVVAGGLAAICNLLILFILVDFFHVFYLIASILSYICSIGAGFSLQKFWAFRDQGTLRTHHQLALYIGVTSMNLGINTVLMYLLVSIFGIWYLAAQILCGFVVAVTGYVAYQNLVFKPTPTSV